MYIADEILAARPRGDRRKELIRRSDELLHQLEQLNVDAYLPVRPEQPVRGGRRVVRLPAALVQAVNELLAEVGLQVCQLWTTTEALDAVWTAQRRIFGQSDEEDEEEEDQ